MNKPSTSANSRVVKNEKTTIYIDPGVKKSVRYYALRDNSSLSKIINEKLFEYLEEQADIAMYEQAKAEHGKDPTTFKFEDVVKELGLDIEEIRNRANTRGKKTA